MSDYTISIPDRLLEKARQFAEQHAQSLDEVILAHLEDAFDEPLIDLPADEQAELKAMVYLSDDALFSMMREQMQRIKQERMTILMDRNTRGTITEAEYQELATLVEQGQRLTLRKATAMNILLDRGFKVRLDGMEPLPSQARY